MPSLVLEPRREHPRFEADVVVHVGARQLPVRARNLSMVGLYLDEELETEADVPLTIDLPGAARPVVATGRVERRDGVGTAISFADIDWDDLLLVARYLSPRM